MAKLGGHSSKLRERGRERERERERSVGGWENSHGDGSIACFWKLAKILGLFFAYQKSEMVGTRLPHGTCVYRTAHGTLWNSGTQQFFTIGVKWLKSGRPNYLNFFFIYLKKIKLKRLT
jgi:hypothetical protein